MLWVWERPEDLRWLDVQSTGVAFLARTLTLSGDEVIAQARRQPLRLPEHCFVIAVVRIEADHNRAATFSDRQIKSIVDHCLVAAGDPQIRALQIDFDSRLSERAAYQTILQQIRSSLPASFPLAITALASWCSGDFWINKLPVDDAVPMLFRMGRSEQERTQYINSLARYSAEGHYKRCLCASSVGIATDEPIALRALAHRRIYLFSPKAWHKNDLKLALTKIAEYQ